MGSGTVGTTRHGGGRMVIAELPLQRERSLKKIE